MGLDLAIEVPSDVLVCPDLKLRLLLKLVEKHSQADCDHSNESALDRDQLLEASVICGGEVYLPSNGRLISVSAQEQVSVVGFRRRTVGP